MSLRRARAHLTSTSPPWQTTKLPSSRLQLMKNSYIPFLSILSHASGKLVIANAITLAYVGNKCASCPGLGPPPKPPCGCWNASTVSAAR